MPSIKKIFWQSKTFPFKDVQHLKEPSSYILEYLMNVEEKLINVTSVLLTVLVFGKFKFSFVFDLNHAILSKVFDTSVISKVASQLIESW